MLAYFFLAKQLKNAWKNIFLNYIQLKITFMIIENHFGGI